MGIKEARLAAIVVPILPTDKEAAIKARVDEVRTALGSGKSFEAVAAIYQGRPGFTVAPPVWVMTEKFPPEVAQALRDKKPGTVTSAIHSGNTVQFLKLLAWSTIKKPSPMTEVTVKQIAIALPAKAAKDTQVKLADSERILQANPGSCEETKLPATPLPAKAIFARTLLRNVAPEQLSVLMHLEVGQVSDPQPAPDSVHLVLLCERSEAVGGDADLENLRQQLFAEKMELEAEKHLRNLRREASIDIRSDAKDAP